MSRSIENILVEREVERPRAYSAPSVATLSTRGPGHVHYSRMLSGKHDPDALLGNEDEIPYSFIRSLHNGNVSAAVSSGGLALSPPGGGGLRGGPRAPHPGARGPGGARHHQRRGTLGRALSISQEQKEKIELK